MNSTISVKCAIVVGFLAVLGVGAVDGASAERRFEARTVSSRPDTVSGGDVLIELSAPRDVKWTAQLNGQDVTSAFRPANTSGDLLALLTGLKLGNNQLTIRARGAIQSKLAILNHPLAGPVFSGPHQQPFLCQTEANGLGPAVDADCFAKTQVQYYYKSTELPDSEALAEAKAAMGATPVSLAPGLKPFDPAGPRPSDVAQTVTSDGRTVPYVIRREVGVINRAVYDIQFLHEPGQPLPTPWTGPTPGWNGRLVYSFGGGCAAGYRQGKLMSAVGSARLAKGYAVATSTLNILGNNCNDRVSAETLSMVKEHFIEQYGKPVHTIGEGGSGGAIQQHLIAQNYPGLLDGILVSGSFPDVLNVVQSTSDCSLLDRAFSASTQPWPEEQKTAVAGYATWRTCNPKVRFIDSRACARDKMFDAPGGSIAKEKVYDRITNPKGLRCDIFENEINIWGRDPRTGLARRPLDNVGVQYGLLAFNRGKIDAEQFIELNERMGGYDEDGNIVATRTQADPETVRLAYERGLVLTGGGGLGETPIIDYSLWYSDDAADGHDHVRSLITRARLLAVNGQADNHVIRVNPRPEIVPFLIPDGSGPYFAKLAERDAVLMLQMDRWLTRIAADSAAGSRAAKIARNKPADLTDGCIATDGETIAERASYDGAGRCNQMYPPHGNPRLAAGAPLTDDVLKCTLKPLDPADYSHPLNPAQLSRLKAVFPGGVCDYRQPGVGQGITRATWQRF